MAKVFGHWQDFPWTNMNRLLNEMNEIFGDYYPLASGAAKEEFPAVNMWSNEDQLVLNAEIAGLTPEEIGINVLEDSVFIQGERKIASSGEDKRVTYHRQERPLGKFKRGFKLPFRVEPEKVTAKYENGILTVTMPRSEREKPKQIKVSVS